nr:MAG TPA: hypothetical protein [Caudoviricetes sp.]
MDSSFAAGKKLLRGSYSQYTLTGKGYFVQSGVYGKVPHDGDIVYFYSEILGRVAHVGIVEDARKLGDTYTTHTIEGNTSAVAFERNGGGVARKEYKFKESDVGGTNRINGFGTPSFGRNTCTPEELIEVARQEIGYLEKASDAMLEEKTANAGMYNYTKYGHWYGQNGLYWCQQFVSWCAYQACKLHQKNSFTGWVMFDGKWLYEIDGVVQKNRWLHIDDRWYVVDGAGYSISGWFKQNEDWYYLNPADGGMLSGQWIDITDESYYLTKSGVMARSVYVKNDSKHIYHWVDEDGRYQKKFDTESPDLKKYGLAE